MILELLFVCVLATSECIRATIMVTLSTNAHPVYSAQLGCAADDRDDELTKQST